MKKVLTTILVIIVIIALAIAMFGVYKYLTTNVENEKTSDFSGVENEVIDNAILNEVEEDKIENEIANTEEEIRERTLELIDRFGDIPKEVENLISVIEIRNMCRKLNITELKSNLEYFVILPYNLKFRLTKGEKHDILLTIKATLKDMIKSHDLKNIEKGKI